MSGTRKVKFYTGERAGQTVEETPSAPPAAPGGTNTETGKQETVDQAVDRMSGANVASNAGKQAQSTDHQNSY